MEKGLDGRICRSTLYNLDGGPKCTLTLIWQISRPNKHETCILYFIRLLLPSQHHWSLLFLRAGRVSEQFEYNCQCNSFSSACWPSSWRWCSHSSAYLDPTGESPACPHLPPSSTSSLCVPTSTTRPMSITTICSARTMVLSRCATIRLVLSLLAASIALCIVLEGVVRFHRPTSLWCCPGMMWPHQISSGSAS